MSDKPFNLLIAGNELSMQKFLSLLFSKDLYCVRFAEDDLAALLDIGREIPDILLFDLDMPGKSGTEFLLVVRRRFPSIRVIAMSYEFSGNCMPLGLAADAFFEKGADMALLVESVAAMVQPERSTKRPSMEDLFGFQMSETIPPHPHAELRTHSPGSPLKYSAQPMNQQLECCQGQD